MLGNMAYIHLQLARRSATGKDLTNKLLVGVWSIHIARVKVGDT
jgi:hypothetical protein